MPSFVTKIIGLFAAMEPEDLEPLAPATRHRFAQILRHWADLAEPPIERLPKRSRPRSGVLYLLNDGERAP